MAMCTIRSSAKEAAKALRLAWRAVTFLTNLFRTTAADPMRGTMDKDNPKRERLRVTILAVAKVTEQADLTMLVGIVVTTSATLEMSSDRTVPMAPGDVVGDDCSSFPSPLMLPSLPIAWRPDDWKNSKSRLMSKDPNSPARSLAATLSCARLMQTVRRNEATPPPMTTTARED